MLYARGIPSIQDVFFHTEFTELKEEVFEGDEAKGKSVVSSPHRIASWSGRDVQAARKDSADRPLHWR